MSVSNPSQRATESASDSPAAASPAPRPEVAAPRELVPGDCLGRYAGRALTGAGGMGRVFAADAGDASRAETVADRAVRLAQTARPGELPIAEARLIAPARWLWRSAHARSSRRCRFRPTSCPRSTAGWATVR